MFLETTWYNPQWDTKVSKYVRLYLCVRTEIEKGNIPAGQPLPSIRQVSKELAISSTTVENAYHQLIVEGYIYSIPKKGYYAATLDKAFFNDGQGSLVKKKTIEKKNDGKEYIDTAQFRFGEWKRLYTCILENYPARLLQEGDPQGEFELRQALSDYVYRARGVFCNPGQIIVGAGVQILLHTFCDITEGILNKEVVFEEPGFTDVRPVFLKRGFLLRPVSLDQNGIRVDSLFHTKADLCYISPSHQYPTGLVMPVQKRVELLKWADQTRGYILEDDYDSELRFFGRPVPSLFSLDNSNRVVYIGSFSTLLIPSLRISFMILPGSLNESFLKAGDEYRSTVSTAEQLVLAAYLNEGFFERHLRRTRKKCAEKLKSLDECVSQYPDFLKLHTTDTGTFVLVEVKNEKIAKGVRKQAEKMGSLVREIWKRFFLVYYGGIQEEKYPILLKTLLRGFIS